MTNHQRQDLALRAALDIIDTLDSLYTATVLLTALRSEIDRLAETDPPDPRSISERAGYLLDRFHEQELVPAMNAIRESATNLRLP
jgi:hypothetical protein